MFVLVPIAAPAHGTQNASPPTLSAGVNAYITATLTAGNTLKITNPISNSYAITTITIFTPASFAFSHGTGAVGVYLNTISVDTASAMTFTGSLAPGFSDTITLDSVTSNVASPASAAPPQSSFTTTLVDGGSTPASYPGPTWTVYTLAAGTAITSVVSSSSNYVAGSAALTVTATLSTNQPGVPITFKVTHAAYPHSGFTDSLSPTSTATSAGATFATAVTSFQPSNHANDGTPITATVGVSAITTVSAQNVTTLAGNPSTLTWTYTGGAFGVGTTYYISGVANFATPSYATATQAEISAASALTIAVSDAFGNTYAAGITFVGSQGETITAPSGIGGFDGGGGHNDNPITCATGITCTAATGSGVVNLPYYQLYQYGTTTVLQATITGTYNSNSFSVAATSANIVTSTQSAVWTLGVQGAPTYGVGTTVTLVETPTTGTQSGVPVTFNLCGQQAHPTTCNGVTTTGYGGSFTGGIQTGFIVNTGGTSGTSTAVYTLPTVLGQVGEFNATVAAPVTGTPTNKIAGGTFTFGATVAGAAYGFQVVLYWNAAGTQAVKSSLVAGQNIYAAVNLVDQYGNTAANTQGTQMQVNLATSAGALFATTLYVASGSTNTLSPPSFGPDLFTVPATLSLGTVVTLTATGALVTGSKTITIVSPTPTINLKKGSLNGPVIPTGTTIYSPTGALTFYSKANASAGFNPNTVTIATIGTKIGSASWVTTLTPNAYQSANTYSLFFPNGLSTLSVNATDSNTPANSGVSGPYNILVDPYLPTFTINTPAAGSGSDTVTVQSTEGDFNTTTFAATYGGNAVPAASISWAGTQTLGTASMLTATISGLTAGTNTLTVSGKTDAGLSNTASASITITVTFANSVTFTTSSATWGQSGAASGIFVPVTNSWSTSLQLTIYATLKSGSSTYVLVGGETLAAGQTGTVFLQDFLTTVPVGNYQVTFSAITTANQAVSAPTTPVSITS